MWRITIRYDTKLHFILSLSSLSIDWYHCCMVETFQNQYYKKAEYLFEALLFWLVVLVEHKTCSLIETSTVTRSDTGWINAGRQICQPINLNKTGLILFTDIVIGVQTSLFSKLYFIYTKITTWWCHNWICLHHCKSNIIQWLNHCN